MILKSDIKDIMRVQGMIFIFIYLFLSSEAEMDFIGIVTESHSLMMWQR